MKSRIWAVLLCAVLVVSLLPGVLMATTALADGTQSLTVTKYDSDGTTILSQTTIDYLTMEATLPVQGDGITHYYMQGISSDPGNLWDPTETINLKDKGILKGTDVKDLCDLVGGMNAGDEVQIKAADGFNKQFQYEDIYNPEPEQGKLVICWWEDGDYVPTYDDGMQSVFFAETTNGAGDYVFGNWDMHECLPEENWHYFDIYPSSTGLSVKNVAEINIFTGEMPVWELTLEGASTYIMPQSEFEGGVACHGVSWDDGTNVWTGIPLWLLVGYVDDGNQHNAGAFNDNLAAIGYDINLIASDNWTKTFASSLVARNDDMIIANEMNGAPLPLDKYPLRLIGPGLTGGEKISMVVKIELVGLPEVGPPGEITKTLTDGWNVISTPVWLDGNSDGTDDILSGDYEGYRWGGTSWKTLSKSYTWEPLEAFYIKVTGTATATFVPMSDMMAPNDRKLSSNKWALIGSSPIDGTSSQTMDVVLAGLKDNFVNVIVPELNLNGSGGTATAADADQLSVPAFGGAWVFVGGESTRTIVGFYGFTPLGTD
jgi:hypothetical protein